MSGVNLKSEGQLEQELDSLGYLIFFFLSHSNLGCVALYKNNLDFCDMKTLIHVLKILDSFVYTFL